MQNLISNPERERERERERVASLRRKKIVNSNVG
jgi:hypothetical protein